MDVTELLSRRAYLSINVTGSKFSQMQREPREAVEMARTAFFHETKQSVGIEGRMPEVFITNFGNVEIYAKTMSDALRFVGLVNFYADGGNYTSDIVN